MSVAHISYTSDTTIPLSAELTFLRKQTGQDEATILVQALHIGIQTLYKQIVEQLFLDGTCSRDEAVNALGAARVTDLEYAQHALEQDVKRGLTL